MRALQLPSLVLLISCNMTKFAADQTADVLKAAAPSLNMESDVQLARDAAPGQLKTVEGFLLATPENKTIIGILAQGYCEYAFGFLESDVEELEMSGESDRAEALAERATGLYLRCMNYGLKLLGGDWDRAVQGDLAAFEAKVAGAGKGSVKGLFFTALGLASAINLNRDDIAMVANLPRAKMLLERVAALDGDFYNGGAQLGLGMLYVAQPKALGGDPLRGKEYFDRAVAATDGKFLMTKVLMAKNYGLALQGLEGTDDAAGKKIPEGAGRKFFHDALVEVLQTSPAIWPEQRLANELAHIRARRYLAHEKELF